MKISYATISECGKRSNNEDAFKVVHNQTEGEWMGVVCDGLGGHPMGEVASATVVNSIYNYYENHRNNEDEIQIIKGACQEAQNNLNQKSDTFNHVEMGTTVVMAVVRGDKLTIAHIGDSRCYVVKKRGEVVYQTSDHTKLSFGFEVLSKCIFSYKEDIAIPEIKQIDIEQGDRILICSDGLYKSIPPEILTARMSDEKTPEEILDTFAFLCERSGDDNYTAVFAIVE